MEDEANHLQKEHKMPLSIVADFIGDSDPELEKLLRDLIQTDHKPLTDDDLTPL